jgi:hypothetical protein
MIEKSATKGEQIMFKRRYFLIFYSHSFKGGFGYGSMYRWDKKYPPLQKLRLFLNEFLTKQNGIPTKATITNIIELNKKDWLHAQEDSGNEINEH